MAALTNVPASELNLMTPINVAKETETEAVIARGVGEAVHSEARRGAVEGVPYASVGLVVVY